MNFEYEADPNAEAPTPLHTGNYDDGVEDPSGLWTYQCQGMTASRKTCQGYQYYGGHNECAAHHKAYRTFEQSNFHPGTKRVRFEGRIWTIDSWDGESFEV
jgi:hypothetical protein